MTLKHRLTLIVCAVALPLTLRDGEWLKAAIFASMVAGGALSWLGGDSRNAALAGLSCFGVALLLLVVFVTRQVLTTP